MKTFSFSFTFPCLATATLAVSIVGIATAQDPPRFRVTDLGDLGFTPNPGPVNEEGTFGISNRDEVVYSIDVNGERHAMLWLPEPNYGLPAGNHDLAVIFPAFDQPSIGRDISFDGKIVGQVGGILGGEGQAIVWDLNSGTFQLLGFLPDGNWSRAFAISDSNPPVVVGESEALAVCPTSCGDPDPPQQLFWRSFRVTLDEEPLALLALRPLGPCDTSSFARDVSSVSGQTLVAGFSHTQGSSGTNCSTNGQCPTVGEGRRRLDSSHRPDRAARSG